LNYARINDRPIIKWPKNARVTLVSTDDYRADFGLFAGTAEKFYRI
jgi:hypothetical protein